MGCGCSGNNAGNGGCAGLAPEPKEQQEAPLFDELPKEGVNETAEADSAAQATVDDASREA